MGLGAWFNYFLWMYLKVRCHLIILGPNLLHPVHICHDYHVVNYTPKPKAHFNFFTLKIISVLFLNNPTIIANTLSYLIFFLIIFSSYSIFLDKEILEKWWTKFDGYEPAVYICTELQINVIVFFFVKTK